MDLLDQWHPEYEDVGTLNLDEICQELSRLDAFEQLISSKQGIDGPDNPDKEVKDNISAEKDSEEAPVHDNPEETRKNTVLNDIDTRRIALRAAAMELSRAKIRPMTIVNLPADILLQIFGYFQDTRIRRQAQIDWRSPPRGCEQDITHRTARETIRQVRLVCSLFNDLASPLLCPILRVDIDQESLNGAVELCKRPRIAQGVHAIQVGLQYRPKELVSDCPKFKDYRKKELEEMANSCDYCAETWFLGGYKPDEETVWPLPLKVYREATSNYDKISRSWDSYFNSDESDENDDVTESEADEYMDILVRGYNEYCKKHEEQLQLIMTGSFVTTLTSCVSQLPNTVALGFTDEMEPLVDWNDPTVVLRDKSLVPGMLSAALEWRKIKDFGDVKLTPARILFDLPVAIHKAGIKLRDLFIGPFPCQGSVSLLCPNTASDPADPVVWSDLRAACSSLRRVNFGSYFHHLDIRHEHLQPEEKYYVDQYLSTVLCSADLKAAWLDLRTFGLNDGRTTKVGWYDIGPVLGAANWPRIEKIRISNVSSKQGELERFCSGLGPSIQLLQMITVHLLDGSWAGILSTLDEKVQSTLREQYVSVSLNNLTGGEFGEKEVRGILDELDDDFDDDWNKPPALPPAGQLLKELHPSLFTPR